MPIARRPGNAQTFFRQNSYMLIWDSAPAVFSFIEPKIQPIRGLGPIVLGLRQGQAVFSRLGDFVQPSHSIELAIICLAPQAAEASAQSALMANLQLPGNVVIEQILRNWLVAIG